MQNRSWYPHLKAQEHKRCALLFEGGRAAGASAESQSPPEAETEYLDFGAPPGPADFEMVSAVPPQPTSVSIGEQGMWDQYDRGQFTFDMDDPEKLERENRLEFERRVAENNLWAGAAETVYDVLDLANSDSDIPNEENELSELLDSMGASQKQWIGSLLTDWGDDRNPA